jgi:hypothetical protein
MASQPHVAALSTTPVKSLRIQRRDRVALQRDGAAGDRAFFLVDERGTMANAKRHPKLNQVVGELDADGVLTLAFPDGSRVSGEPRRGESVDARFYRLTRPAVAIEGDFSAALSAHVGSPLRLVAFEGGRAAVDRGAQGAATLLCRSSADALAAAAGRESIDTRRFRMTIELEGCEPFEEDTWIGRTLRIGGARVRPFGNVGRCTVTTLDPDTGEVDLPTLDLLRELRGDEETSEPLAIGVHCAVVEAGEVVLGDPVEVLD